MAVAERSGISQGKISKIENSRIPATPADVRRLADALGLAETEAAELVERARQAQVPRERSNRRNGVGPGGTVSVEQQDYLDEEDKARYLRSFEPTLVPGLLQTSEYSRRVINRFYSAVHGDDRSGWPDTAAAVGMRIQRQQALYEPDKRFQFVIMESVFENRFGRVNWPLVMAAQIQWIENACKNQNVEIRILPQDAPLPFPPIEPFEILDDSIVLTESTSGGSRRDEYTVGTYRRAFDLFWNASTEDVLPILRRYKAKYLELSNAVVKPDLDQTPAGQHEGRPPAEERPVSRQSTSEALSGP
jgi:transcriptional regulator with XRE-family HTH domain